ncbi:MAG: hypothetical protein ACD_79C00473G0008 [uncultured bacterium]|nr:MAG: hypothetical protein ACD_79C00473G0008 [uncultured bacterium]
MTTLGSFSVRSTTQIPAIPFMGLPDSLEYISFISFSDNLPI